MFISHSKKFICLNPPKTGTGYRERIFKTHIDVSYDLDKTVNRHGTINELILLFEKNNWNIDEYYKFTFVRNPWDRFVSWFDMVESQQKYNFSLTQKGFKSFLFQRFETHPAQELFFLKDDRIFVDYIGSTETLEDDLINIAEELNIELDLTSEYINKFRQNEQIPIKRKHIINTFWTEGTINLVKEFEEKTISLKNYKYKKRVLIENNTENSLPKNIPSVTTVVFAHNGAKEVVNRHLPIWKKNTDNLLIISPIDSPCIINGVDCLTVETSQRFGKHALRRQLFGLKASLSYKTDYYVFLEYDAIMLKRPEPRTLIQGNLFNEDMFLSKDKELINQGKCFMHFPWIFPEDKLRILVENINTFSTKEEKFQNVWLVEKLIDLDLEVFNLLGLVPTAPRGSGEGYSRNSLDTPELLSNAIQLAKENAYAFHGIKTKDVLIQILQAANKLNLLYDKHVYTYYDNIDFLNQDQLLTLWKKSWEDKGFKPSVLTKADEPLSNYGLACWVRWLAYATQPEEKFYVCDYDVINHNFNPIEPDNKLHLMDGNCPCIASGTPSQFEALCKTIISFTENNLEKVKEIYKERKFVHFHDQEFFIIYCILCKQPEFKQTRDRKLFLGVPSSNHDEIKKQIIHYSHADCHKYCSSNSIEYESQERYKLIEQQIKKRISFQLNG